MEFIYIYKFNHIFYIINPMKLKNILLFALIIISSATYSQNNNELSLSLELNNQENYEKIAFGGNVKFTKWLNNYFGLQGGLKVYKHEVDFYINSPISNNEDYYFSEDKRFEIQGILGFSLSSPIHSNFGIMFESSFLFNIIPYDNISYSIDSENKIGRTSNYESKKYDKWIYNHFNPSFSLELSIFVSKKSSPARLNFGIGINNQNPLNAYYRATIDGFKLKDYADLSFYKMNIVLFIRFSAMLNTNQDEKEYL